MITTIRRAAAATATAVLMSGVGALTTLDAASALTVTAPSAGRTEVRLDASETWTAAHSLDDARILCSNAINRAISANIYFSDWARQGCQRKVYTCAIDALVAGLASSGVAFLRYDDGGEAAGCLVR